MNSALLFVWIVIGFVALLLELGRLYGNQLPFAIGGVVAAITSVFIPDIWIQIAVFAIVTLLAFVFVRPLFRHMIESRENKGEEVLLEDVLGKPATVAIKVDAHLGTGRVNLEGTEFRAIPQDIRKKYNVGDKVKVVGIRDEDNCLIVRK